MMKVLDFESMNSYGFMASSLSLLAMGDSEGAIISAYNHLMNDADSDSIRLDISLYIAKIYTKMGEMDASLNLLFRLLRLRRDEGRVYALIAYNFFKLRDSDNARLYTLLTREWNERHNNILVLDDEYILDIDSITHDNVNKGRSDSSVSEAWRYAFDGDTDRAREVLGSISDNGDNAMSKLELLLSLDIADNRDSMATYRLLDRLSREGGRLDVMRTIELLERRGRYDVIAKLVERIESNGITTARLRYIRAVSLYNIGRVEESTRMISGLSKVYGYVYPYMATARYIVEHRVKTTLPIYMDTDVNSDIRLIRDSEVCRLVLTGNVDSWSRDIRVYPLVVNMYEDGIVGDALGYVTHALMGSREGLDILEDILLDREVTTAKMRMYIARNMLEKRSRLMTVYMDMVNECEMESVDGLSPREVQAMRDRTAMRLISGE